MSMKEVFLEGNPPWGFRMNGGADAGHPLRISRVNPGSKAEAKGVREGDLITSINGQSTKCLTNSESHALLRTVKENLLLGLNEDKNASPRRRSREIKSASIISQEKDRSESPAQTKGNKKPSANQKRHQRRTRLRHRIKEMLGLKTKVKAEPEDEEWVIVDASLKSETKSLTSSLPEDEGSFQFIRSNSDPVRNDPEEVYDNFDFKTQGVAPDSSKKNQQSDSATSSSEKNEALNGGDNENVFSKDPRQNDNSLPVSENISSHYQNQISFTQISTVKHSENVKNYEPKTCSIDNPCKKPSVDVIPKTSELSAVEENLSDGEEFSEILSFFPPNEMVEVCNATIMFEDDKLSPETLSRPIISLEDCDQSKFGHNSNPDYEPVEVNSSVIMYPPYSSTLSYYFPQRRLLESISEENSDVSENNDENKEKPWESSQLIREANNIESIPNDWFGSDEGIDTSWRDGRSIEEVSDVPIVSDSHSDSDLLSEDVKIIKTEDKSRFKIVNVKMKDESLKKEEVKKNDVVLGKPPINIVNTYRISGKQSSKTLTMAKSESQPSVKVENPQKEARNAGNNCHDKLIPVTNSVQGDSNGSKVTCKILKQSDIHASENKLPNEIVKCISTSVKSNENKNLNLKSQKTTDKTNEAKLEHSLKHSNSIVAKLPCKVVYHEHINSDIKSVVKSQVSSPVSPPCSTKTIEPVHLKSSDTRNNNNADATNATNNSKNYIKSTPSSSVLKNVVSSYYNTSAVPKKVNIDGNDNNTQSNTCLELSTNVIQPGLERDIELIYIDSSDSDAISNKSNLSASNRTSLSLEKDEVDVLEAPVNTNATNNSYACNNSGHIIKEVITNINQSVKEISDICCETTKDKKSRLFSKSKDNDVVHKYSLLPNLLSPVLTRKCLPSKRTYSKRRFSYPLTDQDILKNSNTINWYHVAVSNDCGGPQNKKDTLLNRNLPVKNSHESPVPGTKGLKDYVHAEITKNTSLTSNKEEAKSTESIFMDFSDGSVSSESYTLPDVTHDNELLSDVSTDTIKYIGLPPSSPRFVPRSPVEVSDIVDLHKKFVERRGYHEASPDLKRKEENKKSTEPDLIALSKCQERSEQAYTPELLAEAANLLALHKYHESRQKKMRHDNKEKNEEQKLIHSDFTKPVERQDVPTVVDSKLKTNVCVTKENRELLQDICMNEEAKKDNSPNKSITTENESVGKSRLLELFQKLELKSSSSECALPEPFPYWLILGHDLELEPENEFNTKCNGSVCTCKEEKVHCAHKIDENDNSLQKHEDSASTLAKLEVTSKYIKQTTSTESKPISLPPGEIFQRKMYEEYLEKIAELAERRSSKVIKISSVPNSVNSTSDNQPLESEFMTKLKERNEKLGIIIDNDEICDETKKPAPEKQDLPKHLKELMEITEECGDIVGKDGLLVEIDEALSPERKGFLTAKGVWSPAQTPEAERKKFDFSNEVKEEREKEKKKEEEEKKEPQPPVWTPRSAGASPTLERKFRSVNFQSPPPNRKEIKTSNETPELPQELPVDGDKDTKSRLTSSSSENSTLSSSLRLPSAQNPTITLLQKAREGQIPRGAQYLDEQQPIFGPDEIIYSVKKEHVLEDQSKKIVELGPRKIEGIGPTTREGIPTVLRSEVKEDNQQRWYKRMYDSLHKADYDKDFVTVKYKTKRKGQYPYTYSGGYASEPERIGYDSDASLSKYATLDRRKIRNKENDFTTSTMPRNRYAPGVKYAVNLYKNQPGRIEDYEPGHSSIAEKETKQWWDEVMDIFDGELNNHSRRNHHSSDFSGQPYTYSLKDTGYESDSTLVFKRRENNMSGQLLSPADQKMAYKVIQKGGDVPFQGLRKAAPERPKEDTEIEYFPLSPTLTRIRVHKRCPKPKEKVYYPLSDDVVYSSLKRNMRTTVPSPPRRESSKYNSTLKLYAQAGTGSPEVKTGFVKDKVVTMLPASNNIDGKIEKSHGKIKSTPAKYEDPKSQYGTIKQKKEALRKSPELKAPAEVKKALKESKVPSGTVVKSSTTLYSSARNKKPKEDKSLKVTVAISTKGKELLTSSSSASSKSDFRKSPLLSKPSSKVKTSLTDKTDNPSSVKSSRPLSRSSMASTTITSEHSKKSKKEVLPDQRKKKEKKPEIISKCADKGKEEEKKKIKKKQENGKKKNGSKKKDKENIPQDVYDKNTDITVLSEPLKQHDFFQKLLLRESNSPNPSLSSTTVSRTPSVLERVKKFSEPRRASFKSEPSLNLNVYLSQKRPVTESRFRSLDRNPSRALSPFYGTYDFYDKIDHYDKHNNVWDYSLGYGSAPGYEFVKSRSSSEPPHTSPTFSQDICENSSVSPSTSRSPSCRRIRRPASRAIETISGVRRKFRSKSLNEADRQSHLGSTSSLCLSQFTDHDEYKSYFLELLHSTRKSEKFKELHKFYSSLERMGELEKTTSNTDLRPRLKNEEVIDFDRWKQLRNKEKAEKELVSLYEKLKDDQKEKGFLFQPKETIRWSGDSGLRHKEKSVEDLRLQYQRMVERASEKKQDIDLSKDVYKPLWRGSSVANLANSLTSVTGSKRGRPVKETHQTLIKPPAKKDKDIGSRLWSSLSMEQVNALKNQLTEIYSTVSNLKHERIQKMKQNLEDYEVNVTDLSRAESPLHVRCNSLVSPDQLYSPAVKKRAAKRQECMKADSISTLPHWKSKPLSENEKRKLSMSLSAEVKERIKKRKHGTLVIPRETLGAVAAIKGAKKLKSPCTSETSPRTCYSLLSDESIDKGEDRNKDFLLVLTPKDQTDDVKKMVDDWGTKEYARVVQTTSSSSSSASTVIHLGYKDDLKSSSSKLNDFSQSQTDLRQDIDISKSPRKTLYSSQSFTDLKDLFGEKNATTYCTLPLRNIRKPCYSSSDSLYKSISPDPMKYYRAYLNVVKAGDVRKLKEKFESYDDIYNLRKAQSPIQKLYQSDPDLTRDFLSRKGGEMSKVVVKGQEVGDVQWLRKRYEPRKVSPVPFKVDDRYMPHINVISKTASLQRRAHTPPSRMEVAKTGNVERLKQQFEKNGMSLLGQMYTSTPEITELRDIAPYLECDWVAHHNPRRSETRRKVRSRPASASPIRQSILKQTDIFANQDFNPEIHRPVYRYQPEPWQSKSWGKPTVTFKEPLGNPIPTPPRDSTSRQRIQESPHRYVESEVNIHYRSPVRREAKAAWPEDELAQRQAEIMRRIYQEQKRTKYLNELHDMYSRRHADNLLPSQKSPIPLNRYDDFPVEVQPPRPRDRTPEPKLVARALYNFVGQTSRELSFRRGDIIYVRRQIDKNWYEGEHNAMVGLFPFNYVEIIPYDGIRTLPKKASEGQARAKFNFQAQTHLELSLVKGELVLLTRRVDENWFEGRIGNRKGIFPVSYVEVLVEPGERATSPTYGSTPSKPIVAPASHSVMLNGAKDLGQQHYQPPRPAIYASSSLPPSSKINDISLVNQTLHIDTQSDPVPYRVMYNYRPQNEDELELKEGDIVYVMEKCDDGWYVGSLHRNGQFGTFPGNYVERIQ